MRHGWKVSGGLIAAAVTAAATVAGRAVETEPPYSPAASIATMAIEDGYTIAPIASEPDIASPVAMDIDESGRLFVVEMPGYPLDTRPTGRVRLLEDTDGDGRYDRSRVFADNLVLPTGVMRWKRGVLVTAAPDLLYLEDTDGDGTADVRRVVLSGFALTNPQHTVNTPLYGVDNWIYLASAGYAEAIIYKDLFGDHGRPLTWPEHPDRPALDPHGHGVRVRIDEGRVEALSGESQFGHGFDRWGHYFTVDNADHARHEVIAARHLSRNPGLIVPTALQDIPDHGSAAQVFPITKRPTFELLTEAGQFTSACAITPYEGGAFPEDRGPSLFVAEPVHNLVHRDVLSPSGATFVARRAAESREFLAAGDSWFRPVFLYVGPDAALYLVDYYRPRIEHPEWSASDVQKDPAPLFEGQDRGRIYRIARTGDSWPARRPDLGRASDDALVAELSNPNLWWRRTAQRLLVERRASGAATALRGAAAGPSAVGRLHALWTLDGLGLLEPALVERALRDEAAGVRESAVQLAEARITCSTGTPPCAPCDTAQAPCASLVAGLLALEHDPDSRVRFAVLAALGSVTSDESSAARHRMLMASIDDQWMQAAALSARDVRPADLFARLTETGSPLLTSPSPGRTSLLEQAASMIAARGRGDDVRAALDRVGGTHADGDAWWRAAALRGLASGSRNADKGRDTLQPLQPALLELAADSSADVRESAIALLGAVSRHDPAAWRPAVARAVARGSNRSLEPVVRADAIALASLDAPERRVTWLQGFVTPHEAEPVQVAAVRALGRVTGGPAAMAVGRTMLERWDALTPTVRSQALDVLIADRQRVDLLLEALKSTRVQAWTLDFWQKRDLVMHEDAAVRQAARALLEEDPRQRAATVKRYAAALDLAGDAAKGRAVFTRVCATCHRLGRQEGGDLGPDLATVRHRPPLGLLGDILLPSQSIAQHYETYVVQRRTGGTEAGILGAQTPSTITLKQAQGKTVTIRRTDIRSMSAAPQSSMPPDLDKVISPDEMADLLAYIRGQ
jgi:putative membrane-bound dehydrogenase-like protein